MPTEEYLVETANIYVEKIEFWKELTHLPVFVRDSTLWCPAFLCFYASFFLNVFISSLSAEPFSAAFYCLFSELAKC